MRLSCYLSDLEASMCNCVPHHWHDLGRELPFFLPGMKVGWVKVFEEKQPEGRARRLFKWKPGWEKSMVGWHLHK